MKFKVGDQVRINAGQMYGQVGRVFKVGPELVGVFVGIVPVVVHPFELIDSHANNGD